jgi:hypothetical protein
VPPVPQPPQPADQVADLLSTPLEELLVALGEGIGRSQAALDRYSIETQRLIDEDPVLAQYGIEATWYQIPSTQLELKVAVQMQNPAAAALPPAPVPDMALVRPELGGLPRLWVQPVNARYQNQFSYDVQAASTVTLSIVAVPPPGPATATTPTLSAPDVLALPAVKALLVSDAGARTNVNFNPGARAWYVLQTKETDGQTQLLVLVKVDDETGKILKQAP